MLLGVITVDSAPNVIIAKRAQLSIHLHVASKGSIATQLTKLNERVEENVELHPRTGGAMKLDKQIYF